MGREQGVGWRRYLNKRNQNTTITLNTIKVFFFFFFNVLSDKRDTGIISNFEGLAEE